MSDAFIGTSIDIAATLLKKAEAVAIPTETVYGLAANALDTRAVAKIFSIKQRPTFDPLIIHLADFDKVVDYVNEIPEIFKKLAAKYTPGPVTFLMKKKDIIPDIVTAGSPYVAIRIPNHPVTLELLKKVEFPLAAPSANPFGYISPTTAEHVADQLGRRVYYSLDGGSCDVGVESTILALDENGEVEVLRKGGLSIEAIEKAIAKLDSIKIVFPEHSLDDDVYYTKAQIYKKLRKTEEMITMYNAIIEKYPEEIRADNALYELADLYENQLNAPDKAQPLYEKIFLDYSGSTFASDARMRYRKLRGDEL